MIARYTAAALAELDAVLDYIAADNPVAATDLTMAISELVTTIVTQPQIGYSIPGTHLQTIRIPRYQYRLYYEYGTEGVLIRNIRNTRMRQLRGQEPID